MKIFKTLSPCMLGLLLCAGGGCSAVGTLLYEAFGAPPNPAKYEPNKTDTLVLVENYRNPDSGELDGDQIAHDITDSLHKNADLPVIDPDKLVLLRQSDSDSFKDLPIPDVGKKVGAKQIIYVDLIDVAVTPDQTGSAISAQATAHVRVVDVESGRTLWPISPKGGYECQAKIDYDPSEPAKAQAMHTKMLADLSDQVSKLFYKWKPDTEKDSSAD